MIVLFEIVIEEVAGLPLYKLKIEFPAVENSLLYAFNKRSFKFEEIFVSNQSFANLSNWTISPIYSLVSVILNFALSKFSLTVRHVPQIKMTVA